MTLWHHLRTEKSALNFKRPTSSPLFYPQSKVQLFSRGSSAFLTFSSISLYYCQIGAICCFSRHISVTLVILYNLILVLQFHVHLWRFFGSSSERRLGLHPSILPGFFQPEFMHCCRAWTSLPVGHRQMCPMGAKATWAHIQTSVLPCATWYVNFRPCLADWVFVCNCLHFSLSIVTSRYSPKCTEQSHASVAPKGPIVSWVW